MIYQFIPFNNEVEMLNLQFIINYGIVDKFIISESNTTFSGIPKSYNFKNYSIFDKYKNKVIYDMVKTDCLDDLPEYKFDRPFKTYWRREKKQRESYFKQFEFTEDDIIFITDVDELVFIKNIIDKIDGNKFNYFNIKHCRYYVNTQVKLGETMRCVSGFTFNSFVKKYKSFLDDNYPIREIGYVSDDYLEHENCGYHLSACYDYREKIQSFSHGEYNTDEAYNLGYNEKLSLTSNNIIDIPDIIKNNIDQKFILNL